MLLKLIMLSALAFGSATRTKNTVFIAVEDSNNYPYSRISPDNERPQGFHIDLVEGAAKKSGLEVHWVPLPWNRAISSMEKGEVDAISYVTPTKDRDLYMLFLPNNVLHEDRVCVVVRKDFKERKFNGTIDSLFGEKVGFATNDVVSSEIANNKKKFNSFEYTVDSDRIFSMLTAGRFDYAFINAAGFKRLQVNPRFENLIKLSPCMKGEKRYIAFSRRAVEGTLKARLFEKGMKSFKRSLEYKKLVNDYEFNY